MIRSQPSKVHYILNNLFTHAWNETFAQVLFEKILRLKEEGLKQMKTANFELNNELGMIEYNKNKAVREEMQKV